MQNKINKSIPVNWLWVIMLSLVAVITYTYFFAVTFNNIRYFNAYVRGSVVTKTYVPSSSSKGPGYFSYSYQIVSNADTMYSNLNRKFCLEINDEVFGVKDSRRGMRIMKVNGEKIQNKYGIEDYASIVIIVTTLLIIIVRNKQPRSRADEVLI